MNREASPRHRLRYLPVSIFAIIMGLSGVTLVLRRLEHDAGGPAVASLVALTLTLLLAVFLGFLYLRKCLRYPDAVAEEWHHPVRISFFPAMTISLILLGTLLQPLLAPVALALWSVGVAGHLLLSLGVIGSWISHREFVYAQLNPAWFIPAVGNVLVPVAGVPFGLVELSWFFFSVGILFWLVLLTLVFNRLIFHGPIPARLLPTLAILIAPPAVGLISWVRLTGEIGVTGRFLYSIALLFLLVVATQARALVRLPFSLAWWAYSFPLAAFVLSSFLFAEREPDAGIHALLGWLGTGLLALVLVVLVWQTFRAVARDAICQPEDAASAQAAPPRP